MLAIELVIARPAVDGVVAITAIGAVITTCCSNGVKAVVGINPFISAIAGQTLGLVCAF